jgi:drug/metabolite transporter (DMT)-like permease
MSPVHTRRSRLGSGYTIALISAAILSTTAVFIRHLTQSYQVPALVLAFWRDVFVSLALLLVFRLAQPALLAIRRPQLKYLLLYGSMLAVFNSAWTLSVAFNGASVATVLAYCSAAFTALLGWWFFKESLYPVKVAAVVICLAGCVLVAEALDPAAWRLNLPGILTGVLSGLMWALYSLMGRSAARRGLNPWTTLFYTFTFAGAFLLVFNLLPGGLLPGAAARPAELFWLGQSWAGWGILILLAVGPTLAGFGLYNVALTSLPSSVVNLIATSEPVFTALIAYLFLGERLNGVQILGALLVLGGVVLLKLYEGWLAGRRTGEPDREGTAS